MPAAMLRLNRRNPPTAMRCFLALAALVLAPAASFAQPLADTLFTWQGYGRTGQCRVAVYPAPEREARTRTFVVREVADNAGPSTLEDARFLVEQIGRTLGVEPASATWVFHWGSFSFDGAGGERKELFLRATFRANDNGRLSPPTWRVVSRADVEEMTDRLLRG
jgi:hypothetical protein